jgi:hypothetical protein
MTTVKLLTSPETWKCMHYGTRCLVHILMGWWACNVLTHVVTHQDLKELGMAVCKQYLWELLEDCCWLFHILRYQWTKALVFVGSFDEIDRQDYAQFYMPLVHQITVPNLTHSEPSLTHCKLNLNIPVLLSVHRPLLQTYCSYTGIYREIVSVFIFCSLTWNLQRIFLKASRTFTDFDVFENSSCFSSRIVTLDYWSFLFHVTSFCWWGLDEMLLFKNVSSLSA